MPLMHCPHCGAENFTMEGWEDLDHCTSCGKPLGEPPPSVARQRRKVQGSSRASSTEAARGGCQSA